MPMKGIAVWLSSNELVLLDVRHGLEPWYHILEYDCRVLKISAAL